MGREVKIHGRATWLVMLALINAPSYALPISQSTHYTISQTGVYDSASEVRLALKIVAPNQCNHIKASLVQRATALAAILDERKIVDCTLNNMDELSFDFTTPQVARSTRLAWEYQSCDLEQRCEAIGEVDFVVLPEDYLKPLIDWSVEHTVFVVDPAGWLVAFLDRLGVQYTENARAVAAEAEVVVLVNIVDATQTNIDNDLPVRHPKRIIEFHDYPSEQPMVWVDSSTEGTVIAIRFPLIHEIEKEAANKKIFYELFQRLF